MQPTLQPLLSLLPSYNSTTLPLPLTTTASALLAQSRLRAANLKPEEEIARPYACAELAVDRLRESLRLPPKKTGNRTAGRGGGGPPCQPAVYRKFLGFLRGVLDVEGAVPRSGGGGKRKRDVVVEPLQQDADEDNEDKLAGEATPTPTPSKRKRIYSNANTPTRSRILAGAKSPASTGKATATFAGRIAAVKKSGVADTEAPASVLPTIRKFTQHFNTGVLAPHVYTGVCVVLRLAELWPRDADADVEEVEFEADVTALCVALYLMVLTKMQRGQLKTKTFNAVVVQAVKMFKGKGLKGREGVEGWIRRVNREGWCVGQSWWGSVPEGVLAVDVQGRGITEDQDQDEEEEEEEDEMMDLDVDELAGDEDELNLPGTRRRSRQDEAEKPDPEGVLLPGLGTMMQESLDWHSAERRRAFRAWKKGIMKRLQSQGVTEQNTPLTGSKKTSNGRKSASVRKSSALAVTAH